MKDRLARKSIKENKQTVDEKIINLSNGTDVSDMKIKALLSHLELEYDIDAQEVKEIGTMSMGTISNGTLKGG